MKINIINVKKSPSSSNIISDNTTPSKDLMVIYMIQIFKIITINNKILQIQSTDHLTKQKIT